MGEKEIRKLEGDLNAVSIIPQIHKAGEKLLHMSEHIHVGRVEIAYEQTINSYVIKGENMVEIKTILEERKNYLMKIRDEKEKL